MKSKRARQAATLYASLVTSLVLGIVVSVINTRLLGPQAFGDFKFLQTVWMSAVLFTTFGFFYTGSNLLAAQTGSEGERRLMGGLLFLAIGVSLLFILGMFAISFPLGQVYGESLGVHARRYAALLFVFPLQIYLQEALKGTNDITGLALLNALPQAVYIPAALLVNHYHGLDLDMALLLYLATIAVTVLAVTIHAKPDFTRIMESARQVIGNNSTIGLHIYTAVLVTTVTTQLSQFTLAYFYDTRLVGMFALAITITMPLTMIPNAIATTFFKQFATLDRIPSKVLMASTIISCATLIVFLVAIDEIITFLYTDRFAGVTSLAYLCGIGAVVHGMGDIYNRYLLVHGATRELRTNATQLGLLSLFGYIALVAWWGAMGAALTKLIVDVVYLATMLVYYRRKLYKSA